MSDLALAGCPVEEVDAALASAEARVLAADALGFEREVALVADRLGCVEAPIPPEVAARVHRVRALWHWAHREDEAAVASLRVARRVAPAHVPSDALLPPGDALRVAYDHADPALAPTRPVRLPRGRLVWFDGTATRDRPTDGPSVVQVAGRAGRPEISVVLAADDRLPTPAWVGEARLGLGVTAGVLAGVAGGLYGGAWAARASFDGRRPDEIAALRSDQAAANGLAGGAAGALLAAVGSALAAGLLR
ncbi:MAG: hypothetical protein H6732_07205 [Alphaproteobacteria bacterium]|nr:hypothetical protein [Alphaproteobacteria bacterium]